MKSRIMYIEDKGGGLIGPARIGRVTFSKSPSVPTVSMSAIRSVVAPPSLTQNHP
jgi:hypothetical protein